jgi:hypothetical protein
MGRHHRNGPCNYAQLLKKCSNQSHNLRDAWISPTIDPTFRERVYQIIEVATVPINVSSPALFYTLDVALLARCPFHSVSP